MATLDSLYVIHVNVKINVVKVNFVKQICIGWEDLHEASTTKLFLIHIKVNL